MCFLSCWILSVFFTCTYLRWVNFEILVEKRADFVCEFIFYADLFFVSNYQAFQVITRSLSLRYGVLGRYDFLRIYFEWILVLSLLRALE